MALHGIQYRFPIGIDEQNNEQLAFSLALSALFRQIVDRVDDEEKLTNFSLVMWPYIAIQAEPNFHVLIDDIGILNFDKNLTNSPRTAQIGHILRNVEYSIKERLELAQKIMEFKHQINIEDDEEEKQPVHGFENDEGEFIEKKISGLVSPDLLKSFTDLFKFITEFNIGDFATLESIYSFDDALNFAKQYIDTLNFTRGNRIRWDSLAKLIAEPIEQWITDLRVEMKDVKDRYKSNLEKLEVVDENIIESTLDSAKDNIDQWILQEQKKIIGKIGGMFTGIDLILEDVHKKNQKFLNTDELKTHPIEDVVKMAYQHIAYIRDALLSADEKLTDLSTKMNNIRGDLENTSLTAEERIERLNKELLEKKYAQEAKRRELQEEMKKQLNELQEKLDFIQQKFHQMQQFIESKKDSCSTDEKEIHNWQLDDNICKIPNPTIRYFLPIAVGLIEDEDEEERLEISFPLKLKNGKFHTLSLEVRKFEKKVAKILDRNMKIRSNFEFTLETKNIQNNTFIQKQIEEGLKWMATKGIINDEKKIKLENIARELYKNK